MNDATPPEPIILVCQNCDFEGEEGDFNEAVNPERRHSLGDIYSDIECPECGALAYPKAPPPTAVWDRDDVQFPRLLCEIQALHRLDVNAIAASMDLPAGEVHGLFERAERAHRDHRRAFTTGFNEGGTAARECGEDPEKYRCARCEGTDVEVCLPGWFQPTDLRYVDVDAEAEALAYFCNGCGEQVPVRKPNGAIENGRWVPCGNASH